MNFDSILILFIAVASISFKPGPGMAAIVARAIENGFLSAFLVSMGAITIELLYFVLAYLGFTVIEDMLNSLTTVLKIIGSFYIFYLAFDAFKKSNFVPTNQDRMTKQPYFKDYLTGISVTLANPLVILFYSALIPTVLDLSMIDLNGLATALLVIFSVHFVILTAQSALAAQVRVLLEDKLTIQKFNLISACVLLGLGAYILISIFI